MEGTTSLRERKKLATWRAIQSAARQLFDEQGYEATTVEQIVAAANVSRATFFNYFASKDATLLDLDPEERRQWQVLMNERPQDEPLWDSLSTILTGFCEDLRDRIPLQRRLKAESPAFAQSAESFGEQFFSDLRLWVESRITGSDALTPILQLNLAIAATITAYQTWPAEESFDEFLLRVQRCLRQAGSGPNVVSTLDGVPAGRLVPEGTSADPLKTALRENPADVGFSDDVERTHDDLRCAFGDEECGWPGELSSTPASRSPSSAAGWTRADNLPPGTEDAQVDQTP